MNEKLSILIIDDERDICDQISGLLEDNQYSTFSAFSSDEALKKVNNEHLGLIILDIWLNNSKLDGFKTLEEIQKINENIPVIMISGHGNIETVVTSIKNGAFDYLEKPFDSDLLLFKVKKAIEHYNLKKKLNDLTFRDLNSYFVHQSNITTKIYEMLNKVSKTESSILLFGPIGSGKEIVSKTIHRLSNRSKKLFKIVDCNNLSQEDLEKKLFGIENDDGFSQHGLLEELNGGTIVFDRIEFMPIQTQGKITRFLENQGFNRLNSTKTLKSNLRIIATSRVDLRKKILEKKFREDLFFQLNVLPIRIPPLSERKKDIKDLCKIFVKDFTTKNNLKEKKFSDDSIEYFKSISFQGNVRQLRNTVEFILIALIDNDDEEIKYDIIPEKIKTYLNSNNSDNIITSDLSNLSYKQAKKKFEKEYLKNQINKFNNNISDTAKFIGMERTALYRKIKDLKIKIKEIIR